MATITVSSNPSTTGDTLTVNFTTDATNITDILLSKDGGSTYISATSFTKSSAVFNISNWDNGTYSNCKLKCVYTESGGGTTDTYYTITYTLNQATSSNSTKSIKKGSSYSTTITANNGYKVNTISCMMGGSDVSNSVVSGNKINIPNVTGDVSVLVDTEAISTPEPEPGTIGNMTFGKKVDNSTHKIVDSTEDWATVNPITVEKGAHYSLQMDATWVWCYAYDDNDNFVKELFTSTGDYNTKYTFVAETTKIRYGCYDPRKYLSYCNLTKTS